MTASPKLWAAYMETERALVAAGVPATSPWWLDVVRAYYLHPTATRLVARVGRGGAKSWISRRTALVEMLFGEWIVPPGERHWMIHVSNRLDEARQGLAQIAAWLRILGVRHDQHDDQIELAELPIGYWALPCTSKAARGPRSIGSRMDEQASWSIEGVNPAEDIANSLDAMAITQPEARSILASSPMSNLDYHAAQFDMGDTEHQLARHAESWKANPGAITQESAWKAARGDQRVFDREYRAIPQASRLACFDVDAVDRAFAPFEGGDRAQRAIILDPSSGRSDAWVWCTAGYVNAGGQDIIRFDDINAIEGRFWLQLSGDKVVDKVKDFADQHAQAGRGRLHQVHADQRESLMLQSAFQKRGLGYVVHDWTNANKLTAVETLRRRFKEGSISIAPSEPMRRELLAFEERITPSGAITFAGRKEHDDHVALLITALIADMAGYLSTDTKPDRDYRPFDRFRDPFTGEIRHGFRNPNRGY